MKIVVKDIETNYNVSKESDLSIFFKWIGISIGIILTFFLLFLFLANILVNFISIEDEKKYFGGYNSYSFSIDDEKTKKIKKIVGEDFKYDIFVINHESENAFALLGGKIAITDKLIENIKYENSLLFIIGHEVAHIENRDVFKSLVSTVPVQIILSIIGIGGDIDLSFLLSGTNDIYSKGVESNADVVGIDFVNNLKGEVSCITYFFEKQLSFGNDFATFLSDHPMDSSRISKIKSIVKKKGYKNEEECELLNF